ncbi:MAG: phosphatidylserine/phosphatidylglycerophosphate/cardiolipin synthase-like enzyme, partial [Myxococcota bacterium]
METVMNSRFAHITRQLVLALSFALVAASSPASASSSILADGQIELYFTNPGVSNETGGDTEADDALIALIDAAASTLDVCLYDFKHPALIDAIVDAHQRGVTVRFVGDDDETDQAGYIAVLDAGIPITLRLKSGIMHNKFLIVDGAFVATGSMNFSEAGVNRNNNHAMILDSAQAAADYLAEFEQMFIDANFGTSKTAFPRTPITLGGTTIDLAFSPKDNPEIVLRDALATADHSVYFMVFSFTRNDVAGDLIAHHNNGVEVVGIYDKFGATNRYATDEDLAEAGVPVLVDGNENKVGSSGGKLHHKVMIIDAGTDSDPIVIAGSYNWSGNASDTNDENVLVLRGNEAIAPFMAEFCEVFDAALPHALTTGDLPDPCAAPP